MYLLASGSSWPVVRRSLPLLLDSYLRASIYKHIRMSHIKLIRLIILSKFSESESIKSDYRQMCSA